MVDLPAPALDALVGAALRGRAPQVETILAMHPGAAARSVHASAVLLDAEGLALLLETDPDRATAGGPLGRTPLALACGSRMGEDGRAAATVRILIEHGADPNAEGAGFAAVEAGRAAVLEALLDGGLEPTATSNPLGQSLLHWIVDECWKPALVELMIDRGADANARAGRFGETPLHVAVRRRRLDAAAMFLDRGADIDAPTAGGDTAWRHATRRPFPEVAQFLAERGADATPRPVDRLALALVTDDLQAAAAVVGEQPDVVRSMTAEEARLIGDLSGQGRLESVRFLLDHGADVEARGLDGGTPLAQCAWFATPHVARLLLERGADVHARGCDHDSTPLGWVAHGSRYSGGAADNSALYVELVELLLDAGATVALPGDPPDRPGARMLADASPEVAAVLRARMA